MAQTKNLFACNRCSRCKSPGGQWQEPPYSQAMTIAQAEVYGLTVLRIICPQCNEKEQDAPTFHT